MKRNDDRRITKDQRDYLIRKEYIEGKGNNKGRFIKRFEATYGEIVGFIDLGITPTERGIINVIGRITCAEDIDEITNTLFLIERDYQGVLALGDKYISC